MAIEEWTFLTNHAHVLACIARDPDARVRELAMRVGITERATQRIVGELEGAGYLIRNRVGRRNSYEIRRELPMRHPLEASIPIGRFLQALGQDAAMAG